MSDTLSLTSLVYGSDCGVVGPRFLDGSEFVEVRRRCDKLLSLTGVDALSALDLAMVEEVGADVGLATEEDMKLVGDLYEMREREAGLRGEVWEGGGL